MEQAIIVPARLASTRFPQKLLHEVRGKPVILWTAERISAVAAEIPLYFAVDNEDLHQLLESAGYHVLMTSADHSSGTDRIAEANREIGAQRIINVQADEPMVTGRQIRMLVDLIARDVEMATLATPLRHDNDYRNSNHVKVVCDQDGRALYFSRAPIPYYRDSRGKLPVDVTDLERATYIHLGLYAYRAEFLDRFSTWSPGLLERIEKLEMLRALEHGCRIAVGVTEDALIEIDTPENAVAFEQIVTEKFNMGD